MALEDTTVARPYAEAVYALAREHKQQDVWGEFLDQLARIMVTPEIMALAGNTAVPREKVVALIESIYETKPSAQQHNFLELLAENGRLGVAAEISRLFVAMRQEDEAVHQVLLRTAFPVDEKDLKAVRKALTQRLGGNIELEIETDESLIGGAQIRIGDTVIDDSVRGRLTQLANDLQN